MSLFTHPGTVIHLTPIIFSSLSSLIPHCPSSVLDGVHFISLFPVEPDLRHRIALFYQRELVMWPSLLPKYGILILSVSASKDFEGTVTFYSLHFYLRLDLYLIIVSAYYFHYFFVVIHWLLPQTASNLLSDITKLCEQFNWQNLVPLIKQKVRRISFQTNWSHRILVSPEYVSFRLDAQFIPGSITYVRRGYNFANSLSRIWGLKSFRRALWVWHFSPSFGCLYLNSVLAILNIHLLFHFFFFSISASYILYFSKIWQEVCFSSLGCIIYFIHSISIYMPAYSLAGQTKRKFPIKILKIC